jgi:hypothetical protein
MLLLIDFIIFARAVGRGLPGQKEYFKVKAELFCLTPGQNVI